MTQSTCSQPAEPGSRQSYIVKWCSLCFPIENDDMLSEMAALQRVLNQADTPSSKNFDTITLNRKHIHASCNVIR